MAFAASDAHSHACVTPPVLCVEFLYYFASARMVRGAGKGLGLVATAEALQMDGQPDEAAWPYDPDGPNPEVPPTDPGALFRCRCVVHPLRRELVVPTLESGRAVVLIVGLSDDWYRDLGPDYVIPPPPQGMHSHAVLAVGLRRQAACDEILVRNSWGSRWGDAGHAWLPWEYVDRCFLGSLVVEGACGD